MAIWNMREKTHGATGQTKTYLGPTPEDALKVNTLEQKVLEQDKKLDKILKLLENK